MGLRSGRAAFSNARTSPPSSSSRHLHPLPTVPLLATIHPPQQPQVTPPLVPPLDASRASLPYAASSALGQKPPTPPPDNVPSEEHVVSWFSDSRSHSSQYTAENTCEMICYLWFSQSSNLSPVNTSSSQPIIPFNPQTARLQFSVSSVFVHFMQKLLQTTQLSQSVIVLSLHYICAYRECLGRGCLCDGSTCMAMTMATATRMRRGRQ